MYAEAKVTHPFIIIPSEESPFAAAVVATAHNGATVLVVSASINVHTPFLRTYIAPAVTLSSLIPVNISAPTYSKITSIVSANSV